MSFNEALLIIVGVICSAGTATGADVGQTAKGTSSPTDIESLRFQFRVRAELLQKPEKDLGEKYEAQLGVLEAKLAKSADLEQIRAIRSELKNYRSSSREEIPIRFRELKRVRELYERAAEKALAGRRDAEARLRREYHGRVDQLIAALTRAGKVDDALALQDELRRVEKRAAMGHTLESILGGGKADHLIASGDLTKLAAGWKWHRPRPEATTIEDGTLSLSNSPGTPWKGLNTLRNYAYLPLPKDAQRIAVNVEFKPKSRHDYAGIMLIADQDNFVRASTGYTSKKDLKISLERESAGKYDEIERLVQKPGAVRILFEIDRETRRVTASFRTPLGGEWTKIAATDLVSGKEISIALYCHQANNTPADTCAAKFSMLEIE